MEDIDHFLETVVVRYMRIDFKAVLFEKSHHLLMTGKPDSVGITDIIEVSIQLPFRRRPRIQIAQCAGGGVPRVLQRLSGRLVVFGEHGQIHNAFALNFDRPRGEWNGQRHRFDRFDLSQNPFPYHPVAPGRGLNQLTARVRQIQRQAVEFELHHIGRVRQRRIGIFAVVVGNQSQHPIVPVDQLLLVLRFIQTPQRSQMAMGLKALKQLAADPSRRRIGERYPGLRLQRGQFVVQQIVLLVADERLVQGVVVVVILV
ncbi:hypothetical protein D1872_227860 [compost metagenome]